jgi:hypothetical protein
LDNAQNNANVPEELLAQLRARSDAARRALEAARKNFRGTERAERNVRRIGERGEEVAEKAGIDIDKIAEKGEEAVAKVEE